jgi:hypothetical protein
MHVPASAAHGASVLRTCGRFHQVRPRRARTCVVGRRASGRGLLAVLVILAARIALAFANAVSRALTWINDADY